MSSGEGSMPPPPLPDKAATPAPTPASTSTPASTAAHAPKAAATFTSFINKNTTGKKFAPKAARRRPAVALPATTTTTTTEAPTQASPPPLTTVPPPVQPVVQVEREESEVIEESVTPTPQNQVEPEPEPEVPVQAPAQPPTTGKTTPASPTRRRRRLPWVAVNHPPDDDDTGQASERTATEGGPATNQAPVGKGKIRWKRKAATVRAESATAEPPSKRTRRPRKAKAKPPAETVDAADEADAVDGEEDVEETVTRKPRRTTKKKKKQATEKDAEEAPPKRKGRPSREATPSDAEERTIDPETTFMDSLASRNIRVGKLSRRERKMREIDWVAIRERRREEDARPIQSKKEQEAADKLLAEAGEGHAGNQDLGPRYHLVDGQIQVIPNTGTVNREADAQREIADFEVVEDLDITAHVTSRSFLKNNKRFPNDFLLPGQGKRWSAESTERFYQGLRSFGTDFQMISQMFPGSARRSIKTKFTREEREHPDWVKEALQVRSEIASHWPEFLQAAQLDESHFADADEVKRQMAENEAQMRERIAAAKEETRQRDLQKAAAGVLDNEDEGTPDGNNDENEKGRPGKARKKGKEKQASFQDEEGVEIVGTLDD